MRAGGTCLPFSIGRGEGRKGRVDKEIDSANEQVIGNGLVCPTYILLGTMERMKDWTLRPLRSPLMDLLWDRVSE